MFLEAKKGGAFGRARLGLKNTSIGRLSPYGGLLSHQEYYDGSGL